PWASCENATWDERRIRIRSMVGGRGAAAQNARGDRDSRERPEGGLIQRPHEVAPLRPGAVVVPDAGVPEQVLQDEPRVGPSLADSAVRHDLLLLRVARVSWYSRFT